MTNAAASTPKAVLEFKSTSLTVPVLVLTGNEPDIIEQQLRDKVEQAPEFFRQSPLLIDLQKLNAQNQTLDVESLVSIVRKLGFMPIGIRGGNDSQNQLALSLGLPVHSLHGSNVPINNKPEPKTLPIPEFEEHGASDDQSHIAGSIENKLVNHPVRSGQRVYAKGDLIVTASVSAGAEIMAEGNIHVYGTLRGRALAGVLGNTAAQIFCSDLQAELISIAGIYQLSDDLSKYANHKPVQISLDKQTLIIKDI